ncbi:MAG: Cell filamentation protein Fic [uncultured Sulfurovum sp.]|uniref:protein adenylyltransferase n=1 Tax=uncultured Sulfurovum sp. TaxID=269237 RepID=A0A6S6TNC4_9BACT|nr:MAG: Cell filamentation protein Fic [uncultured Sulfurovum sp.]
MKYHLSKSSIYIDGTSIPRNKKNIKDAKLIHSLEKKLLDSAYLKFSSELNRNILLDETYFINLHKKTFESLYDFSGVYRDVNMSKGGSQFCLAQYLHGESTRIFNELKSDNYLVNVKEDKEVFAKKLAYYQGELIALHPFYELNGRVTRLYCDMLALFNGYKLIDYSNAIDNGAYIEASIECVQYADSSGLERIILEGIKKI